MSRKAPAKLNLALKVVNKRSDGYHNLKTLFERINLCDDIHIYSRNDGKVRINCSHPHVPQGIKNFAYKAAKKKPFLLILDEINLAVKTKLLSEKDVIKFLNSVPAKTTVYLTGRGASAGLRKRANYVNEIRMIKGPKKLTGEKGIDY